MNLARLKKEWRGDVRRECHIVAFREVVNVCGLQDLGYMGGTLTWKRDKDEATMIRERLDLLLASEDWEIFFHTVEFAIILFTNQIMPQFYLGLIRYNN